MSFPHSSSGLLDVMIVDRSSYRKRNEFFAKKFRAKFPVHFTIPIIHLDNARQMTYNMRKLSHDGFHINSRAGRSGGEWARH